MHYWVVLKKKNILTLFWSIFDTSFYSVFGNCLIALIKCQIFFGTLYNSVQTTRPNNAQCENSGGASIICPPPPQVDKGLTEIYQNLEKQSLLARPLPPRFLRPYCQLRLCHSTPAQFRGTFLFCCVKVHIIWEGHKSKVKISQNFVAFSEYMNFILTIPPIVVIQLGSFFVNQA